MAIKPPNQQYYTLEEEWRNRLISISVVTDFFTLVSKILNKDYRYPDTTETFILNDRYVNERHEDHRGI